MSGRDYVYAWRNGPRWAWEYLRYRRSVMGFLRTLWFTLVCGHIGEACQECGRPYLLWWADPDLYDAVTGLGNKGGNSPGLFCLACFDKKALRKGIQLRWKPEVARMTELSMPTRHERKECCGARYGYCSVCEPETWEVQRDRLLLFAKTFENDGNYLDAVPYLRNAADCIEDLQRRLAESEKRVAQLSAEVYECNRTIEVLENPELAARLLQAKRDQGLTGSSIPPELYEAGAEAAWFNFDGGNTPPEEIVPWNELPDNTKQQCRALARSIIDAAMKARS